MRHQRVRMGGFLGFVVCMGFVVGCTESGPEAVPVKGKVVVKDGDIAPLVGSLVELASSSGEPSFHAYGEIKQDGTFSMAGQAEGFALDGVLPGQYKGRIYIAEGEDDDGSEEDNDDRVARKKKPQIVNPRYRNFETSGIAWDTANSGDLLIEVTAK